MSRLLFPAPADVVLPVLGDDRGFAVRRIFCVGRNYAAHAREMGSEPDREAPFWFTKSRDAVLVAGPDGAALPYPPGTANFHHEVELVVALGAPAYRIAAAAAPAVVFGYACGFDMTRRDLQNAAKDQQRPWDFGKDFENAAVLGPVVPVAQCGHYTRGAIRLEVNGEVRQHGDIADLIHPVAAVIAHLSGYYHLQPGDLIYTGTPEGVSAVRPGDVLVGHIDGLPPLQATITPGD